MLAPTTPEPDRSTRLLVIVLAAVTSGFVLSSVVVQRTSAHIDSLSDTIASTSGPSIERLVALRGLVFDSELALSEHLQHDGVTDRAAFEASLRSLNSGVRSYLALPLLSGEERLWRDIQAAVVRFDDAVSRTADLVRLGDVAAARVELSDHVLPAGAELVAASLEGIEFHARSAGGLAKEVRQARRRAVLVANVLTAICIALGLGGIAVVFRQSQRHRALVQAQARLYQERAEELEQFAGRVAHDIRNPLSAAKMSAHLALGRSGDDRVKEPLARILRSLARADAITTGLLDFARSGAHPDPGARTDPAEVLKDVVVGFSPDAQERRIEVQLDPVPPVLVACDRGVYMSLVGNLVRNAIKYMGEASTRRIVIRVAADGSMVRTEVIDTGPGIAPENQAPLFDPYFRVGGDRAREGFGLGLATVKKLAEGHGGSVGVSSEPGKGSTFWFALPGAGSAWANEEASSEDPARSAELAHDGLRH